MGQYVIISQSEKLADGSILQSVWSHITRTHKRAWADPSKLVRDKGFITDQLDNAWDSPVIFDSSDAALRAAKAIKDSQYPAFEPDLFIIDLDNVDFFFIACSIKQAPIDNTALHVKRNGRRYYRMLGR